jgi:hypothetical protein
MAYLYVILFALSSSKIALELSRVLDDPLVVPSCPQWTKASIRRAAFQWDGSRPGQRTTRKKIDETKHRRRRGNGTVRGAHASKAGGAIADGALGKTPSGWLDQMVLARHMVSAAKRKVGGDGGSALPCP